ncbi:MAG: LysR family transcriptional regulator [Marinoscillum sp.]
MKGIRFRCWIDIDGEKYFGPGPVQLLQLIEQEGSLSKAAKAMGMSYKKAWDIINHLNDKATDPIVLSKTGGSKGGGAQLTIRGKQLIESYLELTSKLEAVVAENKQLLDLI